MFSKKLDVLMSLLSVSNRELAGHIYLHHTYISRLRSGKRELPKDKDFVYDIADYLTDKAIKVNKLQKIANIVGCKNEKDLVDISIIMYDWLTHNNTIKEIIDNLMSELSEDDFDKYRYKKNDCYKEQRDENITQYYCGEKVVDGIETVLKKVFNEKDNSDIYWVIDYLDFCLLEIDKVECGYEKLINKLIEDGRTINIFYTNENYNIKLILMLNKFLPLFVNEKIKPYFINKNRGDSNPIIYVENDISLLALHQKSNTNADISILTNNDGMMNYSKDLFQNIIENSYKLLNVKNYKTYYQYREMFNDIYNEKGNFIYMENNLPVYSLPDKVAKKIDKQNPELNFYEIYKYKNEKFKKIIEQMSVSEIISIKFNKKKSVLFAGKIIEYSDEDFKDHVNEITKYLKKYDNYNIYFSDEVTKNMTVVANDIGGLIIEKYNNSKRLIQVTDKKLNDEFIKYLRSYVEEATISTKTDAIKYLKSLT